MREGYFLLLVGTVPVGWVPGRGGGLALLFPVFAVARGGGGRIVGGFGFGKVSQFAPALLIRVIARRHDRGFLTLRGEQVSACFWQFSH